MKTFRLKEQEGRDIVEVVEEKLDEILEKSEFIPTAKIADQGIGPYEYWGAKCREVKPGPEITEDAEEFQLFLTSYDTYEQAHELVEILNDCLDPPVRYASGDDEIEIQLSLIYVNESRFIGQQETHEITIKTEWNIC
jgi:hypothetical protein